MILFPQNFRWNQHIRRTDDRDQAVAGVVEKVKVTLEVSYGFHGVAILGKSDVIFGWICQVT